MTLSTCCRHSTTNRTNLCVLWRKSRHLPVRPSSGKTVHKLKFCKIKKCLFLPPLSSPKRCKRTLYKTHYHVVVYHVFKQEAARLNNICKQNATKANLNGYHTLNVCQQCLCSNMTTDETIGFRPMHSGPECKSSWKKLISSFLSDMFPWNFVQWLQIACLFCTRTLCTFV